MNILLWHVHGAWTTAFVHGPHRYLIPMTPDRGPDGLGRARTYDWPATAVELTPQQLREAEIDVVIVQRPHEIALAREWTGRDLPAIYLEHNAPGTDGAGTGSVPDTRHPMADAGLPIVHVTHFNRLFWDNGGSRTAVIEHGIPDPGHRYTGTVERAAVVINDPVRRGRTTGTDLLPRLSAAAPLDVFGMRADQLRLTGVRTFDLAQADLHDAMAARRCYLHPIRWTSLGLSLLEAMHLGMPVVALATTEVYRAVPDGAGVISTDPDELAAAARRYLDDPDLAAAHGTAARQAALERYGLKRFLDDWDVLLEEVVA
ncbi:glycosyltransferase [Cryptosporangium phraense]|uniref:Glycosyltransferase family 4 protein n=1 Tax=Cryptosporangium phraense TaxID=2593070 RepID=A0A545AX89_9ACTN|nr:glycosyltransferase [Cryptosporangium phraense]TQS45940.1 glycosyltransferase family 4 protein [Cryptosporangium phraense]